MGRYRVDFTEDAKGDLACLAASDRRKILGEVRRQLTDEPTVETRNRKMLRENPVARWELRAGEYRVFYEVNETVSTVTVAAVGLKEHNTLYIRGKEVRL